MWTQLKAKLTAFLEHLGHMGRMTWETVIATFRRPLEVSSTIYQMEALGLRSMGIACVTAVFVGMVMAVQFAFGLQKFGGMEYTGRIIGLSFSRELAPTLTAIVVGGRIGAGIAAEVGSMSVTEQIDAIRALGADPVKKLVAPRLIACVILIPVLALFADVVGFAGAMVVARLQFDGIACLEVRDRHPAAITRPLRVRDGRWQMFVGHDSRTPVTLSRIASQ